MNRFVKDLCWLLGWSRNWFRNLPKFANMGRPDLWSALDKLSSRSTRIQTSFVWYHDLIIWMLKTKLPNSAHLIFKNFTKKYGPSTILYNDFDLDMCKTISSQVWKNSKTFIFVLFLSARYFHVKWNQLNPLLLLFNLFIPYDTTSLRRYDFYEYTT